MKKDYSGSVSMQCSTCSGTQLEFDEDGGPVRCTGCDRVYADKDELIAENGGRIDRHVEELGADLLKDVHKDLSKMFKKFK
jgi:ribosomal protein S27E